MELDWYAAYMDAQTHQIEPVDGRNSTKRIDNDRAQDVLDAAEELFALHGFGAITVRQIAKLAGVDVALPNYYFGSKRKLFDAVFERRAMVFNKARNDALEGVARRWGEAPPPLAEVIEAFLRPVADAQMSGDAGWRNYCRLIAQVNSSPVWVQMMTSHFDELVRKFIGMVGQSLPNAHQEDLYWAYQCLSGSLSLAMANTGRIQQLSSGQCRSDDFAALYSSMVALFVGGFSAIAVAQHDP